MATETKAKKTPAKKATAARKEAPAAAVPAKAAAAAPAGIGQRRVLVGTVVSDKMKKTIVVEIERQVRHSLYKKYITRSRRFKAHDERNEAKMGDQVRIIESRPLSREKRWALQAIVRRAIQTAEANV